jgi:hypothetical protein
MIWSFIIFVLVKCNYVCYTPFVVIVYSQLNIVIVGLAMKRVVTLLVLGR